MINCIGLSHINITVDSIGEAIKYYEDIFDANCLQIFPNFKNIGFAKSAGFMDDPESVDVSISFLQIPNTDITIELMEYHNPKGVNKISNKITNEIGNVGHIALKVSNIEESFEYLKSKNIELISNNSG